MERDDGKKSNFPHKIINCNQQPFEPLKIIILPLYNNYPAEILKY